jgi:hypothetical protein
MKSLRIFFQLIFDGIKTRLDTCAIVHGISLSRSVMSSIPGTDCSDWSIFALFRGMYLLLHTVLRDLLWKQINLFAAKVVADTQPEFTRC